MAEARCRPPEGTKHGTLHWLRAPDNREKLAVWEEGDRWRMVAGALWSDDAETEGWRYHEPAVSLT
jgi:hypothetical protein